MYIVLSAGHGPVQKGACGYGICEYPVHTKVVEATAKLFENAGHVVGILDAGRPDAYWSESSIAIVKAKVRMIRDGEVPGVPDRAQERGPLFAIEFHSDALEPEERKRYPGYRGVRSWVPKNASPDLVSLARELAGAVAGSTAMPLLPVRRASFAWFGIQDVCSYPVLLEVGYIDQEDDAAVLKNPDTPEKIARAIHVAVAAFAANRNDYT